MLISLREICKGIGTAQRTFKRSVTWFKMIRGENKIFQAFLGTLLTWALTACGSSMVRLFYFIHFKTIYIYNFIYLVNIYIYTV